MSTTLAAKVCVLSTQQERSFMWIDPSEWWWREEWWISRENLWLPAIGTWGYPIRSYKWLRAMSVMFPVCMVPGPHSSISEELLHFIILRPKKPLGLRIIECKHQTFAIEKFRDFIITSQSCPRGKKIFLKKILEYTLTSSITKTKEFLDIKNRWYLHWLTIWRCVRDRFFPSVGIFLK